MIRQFLILKSPAERPTDDPIVCCDGAGGAWFREGFDVDLSHWRPNRTPRQYRAGTSTEICFRFLDNPLPGDWTVAINNHVDVDGILSVYTLVHSQHALAHRQTIIQAAEMGDFWGWGEPEAQTVFQGVTRIMDQRLRERRSAQKIYDEALSRIPALIAGTDVADLVIQKSLGPLRKGVRLVEAGNIRRQQLSERFTSYVIPAALIDVGVEQATCVPGFNVAISQKALLWPHVRAKWDSQRVCLVSAEAAGHSGWYHDLWFPGYHWADTENRWIVPGMQFHDGMEFYALDNPALDQALQEFGALETGSGVWALGGGCPPAHDFMAGRFPLVGRFADSLGAPAVSSLSPDQVATRLAPAFGAT